MIGDRQAVHRKDAGGTLQDYGVAGVGQFSARPYRARRFGVVAVQIHDGLTLTIQADFYLAELRTADSTRSWPANDVPLDPRVTAARYHAHAVAEIRLAALLPVGRLFAGAQ